MSTKEMLKFLAFAPFYVETWIENVSQQGELTSEDRIHLALLE